jgi:hypothetical protein
VCVLQWKYLLVNFSVVGVDCRVVGFRLNGAEEFRSPNQSKSGIDWGTLRVSYWPEAGKR